ncbi:Nuclear speckle splicing regulatory protein 1 -like protein [Escovopsis weberi]|uniref:Nuclear speckle splicing regulatory protein 1-like protein n=1 Tax=Escovopsis weberi TaxID=150374 RepID=A0A0M8MS94_ESCWE|nr:Nuclear speckle splicing regulatory protein 1 -like protein [Escovopsis weberi]
MNKPKLAFGLNLTKKAGAAKPLPSRGRSMFGADDDDDADGSDHNKRGTSKVEDIGGGDFDDHAEPTSRSETRHGGRSKKEIPKEPPKLKAKQQSSAMFGDLSSSLASRKHAETAAELDGNVYEYDAIYDSMKPKKTKTKEDEERKPKYMRSLLQAADVRKRDALIAEEKKIAREREAEGDEFAGKEKFVTEAYKRQQEENRRIEEEERRQEEEEAKKNKGGGMTAFYRKMLDRDEERHAETLKAAEEAERGPKTGGGGDDEGGEDRGDGAENDHDNDERKEADLARELNEQGASIAVNEDGQVVDKRELLRGGLNVGAKKKEAAAREAARPPADRERREAGGMRYDKKQAMRERQTRMMEEQLEQSLKRSREEEQARREEAERNAKSRKTAGEISSAKERYLARKKAAEEEKRKKEEGGNVGVLGDGP